MPPNRDQPTRASRAGTATAVVLAVAVSLSPLLLALAQALNG